MHQPEVSWSDLLPAGALPPGRIHSDTVDGRAVVVWRSASGRLAALDAHCPHLGAHLGAGRLQGETITCPFHGWRFDTAGDCVEIGYPGRCPSTARLPAWEVEERDGRIRVRPPAAVERFPVVAAVPRFPEGWYKVACSHELSQPGSLHRTRFGRDCAIHRSGEGVSVCLDGRSVPAVECGGLVLCWYGGDTPAWAPPPLETLTGPRRVWKHFSEEVSASLQDIAENPFDTAHLHTIHSLEMTEPPALEEDGPVLHQRFAGVYAPAMLRWLRPVLEVRSRTWLRAWGLGLTVARIEVSPVFSETTIIGANTPVDIGRTEYSLIMVSKPSGPLGRAVFPLTAQRLWTETLPERKIWADKRYAARPHLTGSERALGRFRRWSRRFPER